VHHFTTWRETVSRGMTIARQVVGEQVKDLHPDFNNIPYHTVSLTLFPIEEPQKFPSWNFFYRKVNM